MLVGVCHALLIQLWRSGHWRACQLLGPESDQNHTTVCCIGVLKGSHCLLVLPSEPEYVLTDGIEGLVIVCDGSFTPNYASSAGNGAGSLSYSKTGCGHLFGLLRLPSASKANASVLWWQSRTMLFSLENTMLAGTKQPCAGSCVGCSSMGLGSVQHESIANGQKTRKAIVAEYHIHIYV